MATSVLASSSGSSMRLHSPAASSSTGRHHHHLHHPKPHSKHHHNAQPRRPAAPARTRAFDPDGEDEGDVDDLELLEAQDLLDYDEEDGYEDDDDDGYDSRSEGERGQHGPYDDEEDNDGISAELKATTVEIVSALGGLEEVENQSTGDIDMVYVVGDDCLRCLRDLRKLWHQGGDDPERLVAHVFADVAVLQNLVPLLLKTAGGNERYQKIALACTDLLTSITWPVDADGLVREMIRRGEDTSRTGHLYALERNMVLYKASVLRQRSGESTAAPSSANAPTVLSSVMRHILLPAMAKPAPKRTERDVATISMVLHLFRNLLAVRDPVATSLSSAEQIQNSTLQSELVCAMQRTHILDTLLMLADSAETRDFAQWNAITLECIYAIFGGEGAETIASNTTASSSATKDGTTGAPTIDHASNLARPAPAAAPQSALASYLSSEARQRQVALKSSGSSRHSRFGTTLNFLTATGDRRVARNASSLRKSVSDLRTENTLRASRKMARRRRAAREQGAPKIRGEWTREARDVLRDWADRFLLSSGFETLARSVLKDILSEREKMGDLDEARMRFMLLSSFFLDYFQLRRQSEDAAAAPSSSPPTWSFSLLAYWLQQWPFRMVHVRTSDALDTRNWQELTASLRLWMSLLRLVDSLSKAGSEAERDLADALLSKHFYHSDTLDLCVRVGRAFTSQSFEFLQTVVAFANYMPRVLERYATNREHIFVRAKAHVRKARAKRTGEGDEQGNADVGTEQEETEERTEAVYTDRRFSFEKFQAKLCIRPLVHACVTYLSRWRDFSNPAEHLAAVTAVMHRIAIKAGDVRSFYPPDIRAAFRSLLQGPLVATLAPRAPQAAKDTQRLMEYCLKRFEKLPSDEKQLWESGKRPPRPKADKPPKHPREIMVLPGLARDDQLGVAVGLLASREHGVKRVFWFKSALEAAAAERTALVLRIDGRRMWDASRRARIDAGEAQEEVPQEPSDEDNEAIIQALTEEGAVPSEEAVAAFEPYVLSYGGGASEEEEDARKLLIQDATTSPPLKLLARLLGLESDESDAHQWKWTVPKDTLPLHLDADAKLLEAFIDQPLQLPERGGGGAGGEEEEEGGGRRQSYEDWVRPAPRKRAGAARAGSGPGAGYASASDSDTDASASALDSASDSDADADEGQGRRKRPRRRADLVGDKRKVKRARFDHLRKKKENHAPLFLREDVIGSDEEEEVERAWRRHVGEGEGGVGAAGHAGSRGSSPRRRRDTDGDSEMGSGSESDTPPTSPPPRRATQDAPKQKTRKSTALFFSSDEEEDDDGVAAPAPAPTRAPALVERTNNPQERERVKPLFSDDDDEDDEDDFDSGTAPTGMKVGAGASGAEAEKGGGIILVESDESDEDEDEDEDAPILRAGTQSGRAGVSALLVDSDEE